jgi:hypothetical protein
MTNFEKLCLCIIDTNGTPREDHVKACGYGDESYQRIISGELPPERLVKNAIRCLKERGIHVKNRG